jgi:hypothetical protein
MAAPALSTIAPSGRGGRHVFIHRLLLQVDAQLKESGLAEFERELIKAREVCLQCQGGGGEERKSLYPRPLDYFTFGSLQISQQSDDCLTLKIF